jgi:anti-sigma-K factor RskA
MELHDLTAAYALGALGDDEAEAYERHLGQCEQCRAQLGELNEASAALAYAAVAPPPPPALRTAILDAAKAERANVVPLRPRSSWRARGLAVAAAAVACAAVGFGVAATQSSKPQPVTAVVVLRADRHASLQVDGLAAAPRGKTYEAWIIPAGGSAPRPAGLFAGGGRSVVQLPGSLPARAVVAITIERAGGVRAPTTAPILTAQT